MALRRIFFQFGALAGCVGCGLTLWWALTQHNLDFLQASLRALGAGAAILFISLIISGIIEKLGGTE